MKFKYFQNEFFLYLFPTMIVMVNRLQIGIFFPFVSSILCYHLVEEFKC